MSEANLSTFGDAAKGAAGTVPTTVVGVLTEARTLLIERGWARGAYRADDGCFCMAGAVLEATRAVDGYDYWILDRAMFALAQSTGRRPLSVNWNAVTNHNDCYIDNKEQAVAWANRAIERAIIEGANR